MAAGMGNRSDSIRDYVRATYVDPARRRGEHRIKIVAGEVHSGIGLRNRMPLVCSALRSRALLSSARLRIVSDEGPPSGLSSTVTITYELLPEGSIDRTAAGSGSQSASSQPRLEAFRRLRGIARQAFSSLGGGEKFLRGERERFHGRDDE